MSNPKSNIGKFYFRQIIKVINFMTYNVQNNWFISQGGYLILEFVIT